MKNHITLASLAFLAALTLVSANQAQAEVQQDRWKFNLRASGAYVFEADFDTTSTADVSVGMVGSGLGVAYIANQQLVFTGNVELEYRNYEFSGLNTAMGLAADPLDDIISITLRPGAIYHINEQWAVLGGGIFTFAGDPEADLTDGFIGGGYIGAQYTHSDKFRIAAGIAVTSQIEDDDPQFRPYINLYWEIMDNLSLETTGPELRLTHRYNEQWAAFVFAAGGALQARLDETSTVPSGVLEHITVTVGIGATWTPIDNLDITAMAGAVVYQEIEIENAAGTDLFSDEVDPTAALMLKVGYRF